MGEKWQIHINLLTKDARAASGARTNDLRISRQVFNHLPTTPLPTQGPGTVHQNLPGTIVYTCVERDKGG